MVRLVFLLFFLFQGLQLHAQSTQTIRGSLVDNILNERVAFASIIVLNTNPLLSTTADSLGHFKIANVPIARYDIQISCAGYEPTIISEVAVGSAKEVFLTIRLKQKINMLNEVAIKTNFSKQNPLSTTTTVSNRLLSVEEAQRYAGGFDDPARLVSAFAGVSANLSNNAIIVRGNNPQSLQWKLEGVEIPSPNHLGDMRVFGGGSITALSAQLLANSDFLSGAMPAEYNNALSGVFDIFMRDGNNKKHEHTFQLGVVGIDLASEGPFKQGGKSSYLFNYRYSTLALVAPLLAENAGGIKYQDLSFKLNFPTRGAGTFSIWGMGLTDRVGAEAKHDIDKWVYDDDRENHNIRQFMGVAGISHSLHLNKKQYLKSTLAAIVHGLNYPTERLDSNLNISPKNLLDNRYQNIVLSSFLNTKFHPKHINKVGFTITNMNYDLLLQNNFLRSSQINYIAKEKGNSSLISAYTNSTFHIGDKTTINAGVNTQFFTLNSDYSIEPRFGIKYNFSTKQSLGFAYGLHSRLERLNYYFIRNGSNETINRNLSFTKANHLVAAYNLHTSNFGHFKAEIYYQHLYDVPVIPDSSFSMLNQQNEWFINTQLKSKGIGRNYGIDITFERSLSDGYYYISTVSIFNSQYQGGDRIWRNTRYNRNYAFNFLFGKEWFLGKKNQNILGINARISYQGGDHYSPINKNQSIANQSIVFDEASAFSLQYPSALTSHLSIAYKLNKKSTTQEISLKVLNVTGQQEYLGFRYNYQTNSIDVNQEPILIPNLSYRIDF